MIKKMFFVLALVAVTPFAAYAVFSDGFESGDLSAWDGAYGATPSAVTSLPGLAPHSGSYMGRLGLDPYDATGSGIWKDLNLTNTGDYVEGYLGLSSDGATYPSQSIAMHIGSSNAYMQIELHGDGTVHFQHDWQQDVYFTPSIPALAVGDWLYVKATIVPQGSSGASGVVLYAEDQYGNSASVGNYYLGGGWEYAPDIMTVRLKNGSGTGNFPGGFDDFSAVPEPATLSLLGFGALAMIRCRKKS